MVRDDESAGSLTFFIETNRPANVPFTVQVCTEDIDLPDLGMATGIHQCMQTYINTVLMHLCLVTT